MIYISAFLNKIIPAISNKEIKNLEKIKQYFLLQNCQTVLYKILFHHRPITSVTLQCMDKPANICFINNITELLILPNFHKGLVKKGSNPLSLPP